jgi:hypothetical protein
MGVLAERLAGMRVRASLPNGGVSGEFSAERGVDISFSWGTYRTLDERELERRLASLAKLLRVAQAREYYAAVSEAFGRTVTKELPPLTPRDVAYDKARAELVAEGWSADGRVGVAVRGMAAWTVRIAGGTLRALDEREFAERFRQAGAELLRDQAAKIQALKDQIYRREDPR